MENNKLVEVCEKITNIEKLLLELKSIVIQEQLKNVQLDLDKMFKTEGSNPPSGPGTPP